MNVEAYFSDLQMRIDGGLDLWDSFEFPDIDVYPDRDREVDVLVSKIFSVDERDIQYLETPESTQDGSLRCAIKIPDGGGKGSLEDGLVLEFSKFERLVCSDKEPLNRDMLDNRLREFGFRYVGLSEELGRRSWRGVSWYTKLFMPYDS